MSDQYPHNEIAPWLAAVADNLSRHGCVTLEAIIPHLAVVEGVMWYGWLLTLIDDGSNEVQFELLNDLVVRVAVDSTLQGTPADLALLPDTLCRVPEGVKAAAKLLVESLPRYNKERRSAFLVALTAAETPHGAYPSVERLMIANGQTYRHAGGVTMAAGQLARMIRALVYNKPEESNI